MENKTPNAQNISVEIQCPVTGEKATGDIQGFFAIPSGLAGWWHCSACLGWHLNLKIQKNLRQDGTQA